MAKLRMAHWANIGGNKFSHTGVSPKWVKSKRWREKKGENGEKRKKERRGKVGNNNGQLRIANATSVGAFKLPGPIT